MTSRRIRKICPQAMTPASIVYLPIHQGSIHTSTKVRDRWSTSNSSGCNGIRSDGSKRPSGLFTFLPVVASDLKSKSPEYSGPQAGWTSAWPSAHASAHSFPTIGPRPRQKMQGTPKSPVSRGPRSSSWNFGYLTVRIATHICAHPVDCSAPRASPEF